MKNKSLSFFKKVISSRTKPYQPTNEKFSISEWQDEFWSSYKPNIREYKLFQSGIWFNECFKELKNKFYNIPYYNDTKDRLIRFQVGAINNYVNRETKYSYTVDKKEFKSSDLFNLEETIESVIDSLRHILIKIKTNKNLFNSDISLEDWLNGNINLCLMYDELNYFWMQCLWYEWYIESESQKQVDLIIPNEFKKGIQHHKSLSWRNELNQMNYIQALEDWQNMPIQEKYRLLILPILEIAQIDDNNNIKLNSSNIYSVKDVFPSEIAAMAITLNNICYHELLRKPCPNFNNLTLLEILNYWKFISPLASQLINKTLSNKFSFSKDVLLKASPTFQKQDLLQITLKTFDFSYEQANAIIDLFTFTGEYGNDLWCQPLIKVDENSFTVIYSCLKRPNLLRSLGTWLEKSGLEQGKLGNTLGKIFENHVITKLKKFNKLSNLKIYNHPIDIGKKNKQQQETDLIITIGNTIIIGESKHHTKYPTEPIEYNYYYEQLEEGGKQLAARKNFIENNLKLTLKQLGITHIEIEQVKIIPVLISNLPLATGQKINGFSVVDLTILEQYISSREITISRYLQQDNKLNKELKQRILLYSSEKEAEENIENYLEKPPQIFAYLEDAQWIKVPLPKILQNKDIVCAKPVI